MRNLITLVESINAIPSEIVEQILSSQYCQHGPKVGVNTRLWRGESEDSGSGMAILGGGIYFAAKKSYAAKYGKVREIPRDMLPWGCLRFNTQWDFQMWLQTTHKLMGYDGPKQANIDYPDFKDFIHAIDPNIDGIQLGKGTDAIFVRYMD